VDKNTQTIMFSSDSGEYQTPDWVFKPLHEHFDFTVDAAASTVLHKLPRYMTIDGTYKQHFSTPHKVNDFDGLIAPWKNERIWCNPPYGRGIDQWVRKAACETHGYDGPPPCPLAVLLLPARTETEWMQQWVFPYAHVYFNMGRIAFEGHNNRCIESGKHTQADPPHTLDSSPFPSIIAVYRPEIRVPARTVAGFSCDLKSGIFEETGMVGTGGGVPHRAERAHTGTRDVPALVDSRGQRAGMSPLQAGAQP